jgi:hypothetical protein
LVLGYQFDPQAIGGVKILLKRFFYEGMFPVNSDAFHLEWIASTLPAGTAATGGFMSDVVAISQVQPLLLPLVAFVTAFYLVLGEWLACAISRKYSSAIVYYSIACVYIFALIIWVGSVIFLGMLLILILVYLFPRINLRLKIQHQQDRSVSKKSFLIDQV